MHTGALLVKREDEGNAWSHHLYAELRVATSKVQGIPVAVWRQQSVHPSVLEVWREGGLSQRHGRGQMWAWVFPAGHIYSPLQMLLSYIVGCFQAYLDSYMWLVIKLVILKMLRLSLYIIPNLPSHLHELMWPIYNIYGLFKWVYSV